MSNHKSGEIPDHRKPKVSLAMAISQGLGDPKANPKGVAEGQPVNIPAPRLNFFLRWRKFVVFVYYWIYISALRIIQWSGRSSDFGRDDRGEQFP